MKQILHIFRKDTRHLWPEILASLVIVFACALLFPLHWKMGQTLRNNGLTQLTAALMFLAPLSWWLLIARVTHSETLIGDQQFWITRPYEWKKLLAAKILFIAAWIGLPFLLAQSLLLLEAGLNPLPSLPGLLFAAFLIASVTAIPLFAIASVTAGFARMTLTLLGILLAAVVFSFLSSLHHGYSTSNPYHNVLLAPLLFVGCIVAITLQYATRRTWRSRCLLLALPLLLIALGFAYDRQSLVDRAYPVPSAGSAPIAQGILGADSKNQVQARVFQDEEYIDIPLRFVGIADGYAVVPDDFRFTLIAADGSQWTSPWQMANSSYFPGPMLPPVSRQDFSLRLDRARLQQFSSAPVTVHITYAATLLRAESPIQTTFPASETSLPGLGLCAPKSGWNRFTRNDPHLFCKRPLHEPALTYLTAQWSDTPCSDPVSSTVPVVPGNAWLGMVDPYTDVNQAAVSVSTSAIRFSHSAEERHICSGSPFTITHYYVAERTQFDVTLSNFQIPAVAFGN